MSYRTLAVVVLLSLLSQNAPAATLGIAGEDFQFQGDWAIQNGAKGVTLLFAGEKAAKLAAVTAVQLPKAGRYRLWVRSIDYPQDRPGTRTFKVAIAGKLSGEIFGDSGQADWSWENGGDFDLPAGPVLVSLEKAAAFARCNAILLTDDLKLVPNRALGRPGHPHVKPIDLPVPEAADLLAAPPVTDLAAQTAARLENEFLRVEFIPAKRGDRSTIAPRVSMKSPDGTWADAAADPAAEAYVVVACPATAALSYAGFYPRWQGGAAGKPFTVEAGGAKVETSRGVRTHAIWDAGTPRRFIPKSVTADGNRAHIEFHPEDIGTLAADWELKPAERTARVKLTFTPAAAGQYSLGYHAPVRRALADVEELLLPLQWQRKRFPSQAQTLLDPVAPTPLSLVQVRGMSWAVVGDAAALPFAWPNPDAPHFGLNIREDTGRVQPSIYGPVPGTPGAKIDASKPLTLSFHILATPRDWYGAYRIAADEICGFRDYRKNVNLSLSDAALNMIDLLKDDQAGGWWERGKGFYQIETKNGVTHAAPMVPLSIYRLTGDEDLYRRRALPTIEFSLSRSLAHFSPTPDDTGPYPAGAMGGPIVTFGSSAYSGLWELGGRQSEALRNLGLPDEGGRIPVGYGHHAPFDEWLARYLITGDTAALEKAKTSADQYIKSQIEKPPTGDLGPAPFFFISFVPDWEGLLQLYEVTQEKRYLDAASFGARQLMTGVWTQPLIPEGQTTIHPTGQYPGDTLPGWRGDRHYRLGTPRKANDTPAHDVPAWVVSNVGLSFEQPSTIRGKGQDRLIYQMGWAPGFLRLARHTGDRTFETYARNATVGRWANYPGYYATGFTDLPLNPRYPYDGPDVTDIYYHHIATHLAWTIDYLVADAELHSNGQIHFPSLRQFGYAYFDNRIFGHAPGTVFGDEDIWLWLTRGLATVDNPQLNALTAHGREKFYLILTNQNDQPETATVTFSAQALVFDPVGAHTAQVISANGARAALAISKGRTQITVPARGLVAVVLDGVTLDVPAHRPSSETARRTTPQLTLKAGEFEIRGAAIPAPPGLSGWQAYVWCTATPKEAAEVTFRYRSGDAEWHETRDMEYPYELSVPVENLKTRFEFKVEVKGASTETATLNADVGAGQ